MEGGAPSPRGASPWGASGTWSLPLMAQVSGCVCGCPPFPLSLSLTETSLRGKCAGNGCSISKTGWMTVAQHNHPPVTSSLPCTPHPHRDEAARQVRGRRPARRWWWASVIPLTSPPPCHSHHHRDKAAWQVRGRQLQHQQDWLDDSSATQSSPRDLPSPLPLPPPQRRSCVASAREAAAASARLVRR